MSSINIIKLFIILCIINLIECANNPMIKAVNHTLDLISPIQKDNKPICLSFVGNLKSDPNPDYNRAPTYYGCIPIGKDIYSSELYYKYKPDYDDNSPIQILILNQTKVLYQFNYDVLVTNQVTNIYQLNIGGVDYNPNYRDVTNRYTKIYYDTKNLLIYSNNDYKFLGLVLYNLTSGTSNIIQTNYTVDYLDVYGSLQCDFNTDLCYMIDGYMVYEFDIVNKSSKSYTTPYQNYQDYNSVNGYKDKLLISGNIDNLGYVYLYNKVSNTSTLLLSPTDVVYVLARSANSRYCGVITQTYKQFYLFDLETETYQDMGIIKINEMFNSIYFNTANDEYRFSLSSIIPTIDTASSLDSSSSNSPPHNHSSNECSSIQLNFLLNTTLIILIQVIILLLK